MKPRIICRAEQSKHRGVPLDEPVGIPSPLSPNQVAMSTGLPGDSSLASVASKVPTTDPLVACSWSGREASYVVTRGGDP